MDFRIFTARLGLSAASAIAAVTALANPASAQSGSAEIRETVLVHLPIGPIHSDAGARRAMTVVDRAALGVCGASDVSFPEVKAAIRHSACYTEAVTSAVKQAGDSRLNAWWASHRP